MVNDVLTLQMGLYLQFVSGPMFQVPVNASANLAAVSAVPSVMWWVSEESTDLALDCLAWAGLGLSAVLLLLGAGNAIIFTALWALYHSIVNVGQQW